MERKQAYTKAATRKARISDLERHAVNAMKETEAVTEQEQMKNALICPVCSQDRFVLKYEASHIYSYFFDSDAPGLKNKDEFLSFRYDRRVLTRSDQYVECRSCGSRFPCSFNVWDTKTSLRTLQASVNNSASGHKGDTPQ